MWASVLLLTQADPAALIERLRSDDIEVRQSAEAEIVRMGAPAEHALDEASWDADPEVAARARRLLRHVVAPHRREVDRAVRHLLVHLGVDVEKGRVASARVLTDLIRWSFPDHPASSDEDLIHGGWETCARAREDVVKRLRRGDAEARFTYPGREKWNRDRGALREAVAATRPAEAVCVACVEWRLETVRVGMAFENAKLEDILAYLGEIGSVNLILDAMMSDEARDLGMDRAVTMEAKDVTLAEALDRVLRPYGLGYQVMEEEGVLLISLKRKTVE